MKKSSALYKIAATGGFNSHYDSNDICTFTRFFIKGLIGTIAAWVLGFVATTLVFVVLVDLVLCLSFSLYYGTLIYTEITFGVSIFLTLTAVVLGLIFVPTLFKSIKQKVGNTYVAQMVDAKLSKKCFKIEFED